MRTRQSQLLFQGWGVGGGGMCGATIPAGGASSGPHHQAEHLRVQHSPSLMEASLIRCSLGADAGAEQALVPRELSPPKWPPPPSQPLTLLSRAQPSEVQTSSQWVTGAAGEPDTQLWQGPRIERGTVNLCPLGPPAHKLTGSFLRLFCPLSTRSLEIFQNLMLVPIMGQNKRG